MSVEVEFCRNGHLRTPENTMYENLKGGKKRRRCRICRQLRASKNRESVTNQPVVGDVVLVDKSRTQKDIDNLPEEERVKIEKFQKALKLFKPNCRTRTTEFTDYGEDDADEIPSPYMAAKLCSGCPLIRICDASAEVELPAWGVRATKVWAYGNVITHGEWNG